ncbi:hypothetical protein Ppb6_03470 [Photorhabdus australis subsp. thailandensis]|uniref:Uncharacterized protein n=1 Tax=Photorhabdus australis subsp. thailandensis TaxID=2805096 RepID=A0A1C0U008_9GAMM|nr:hypothetical protein Ppb6_03470 [Photorhabdus australis subsp. thailandensis]
MCIFEDMRKLNNIKLCLSSSFVSINISERNKNHIKEQVNLCVSRCNQYLIMLVIILVTLFYYYKIIYNEANCNL